MGPFRVLRTLAAPLAAALLVLGGCSTSVSSPIVEQPAERPLAIPTLETGVVRDGVRTFDLRVAPGSTDFGRGVPTAQSQ